MGEQKQGDFGVCGDLLRARIAPVLLVDGKERIEDIMRAVAVRDGSTSGDSGEWCPSSSDV